MNMIMQRKRIPSKTQEIAFEKCRTMVTDGKQVVGGSVESVLFCKIKQELKGGGNVRQLMVVCVV